MGEKLMTKKTAALYARFSSELQKDRSVDDQFALCEQVAKREGFKIVARYCDRAKSGSKEFGREGFQQLKDAARRREFDVIIVEEHDRLSRDQEGMAGFWKRLKHYGIELWTPKGKQNDLDVGIRSFLCRRSSSMTSPTRSSARRGRLSAKVSFRGRSPMGYDRLLHQPGVRVINEREAEVVRRIFREYADRISPREIAAGLTRDGMPTPSGGKNWNHQTFVGGSYARGFIGNRIYIGEIVWNTHRQSKDPETEKTLKRPTPASDHIIAKAPELRIIDQTLWDRAQAVRNSRSLSKFGPEGKVTRTPVVARNDHLLAGLLRCGACNGHMRIANTSRNGSGRVACAAAHQHGTCKHSKTYDLGILKALILDKLRGSLVDPEAIREATRAFHERFAERAKRDNVERIAEAAQQGEGAARPDRCNHPRRRRVADHVGAAQGKGGRTRPAGRAYPPPLGRQRHVAASDRP
jgi:DNA invertase Pin-like site-specific DNA recombinase